MREIAVGDGRTLGVHATRRQQHRGAATAGQLVLSDPATEDLTDYGVFSEQAWRFVDQSRRMEFLLAGFGWCKIFEHLVAPPVAAGQLKRLRVPDEVRRSSYALTVYAATKEDTVPGQAAS